eukprot:3760220-Pyramimonas_sp.AAC.1
MTVSGREQRTLENVSLASGFVRAARSSRSYLSKRCLPEQAAAAEPTEPRAARRAPAKLKDKVAKQIPSSNTHKSDKLVSTCKKLPPVRGTKGPGTAAKSHDMPQPCKTAPAAEKQLFDTTTTMAPLRCAFYFKGKHILTYAFGLYIHTPELLILPERLHIVINV